MAESPVGRPCGTEKVKAPVRIDDKPPRGAAFVCTHTKDCSHRRSKRSTSRIHSESQASERAAFDDGEDVGEDAETSGDTAAGSDTLDDASCDEDGRCPGCRADDGAGGEDDGGKVEDLAIAAAGADGDEEEEETAGAQSVGRHNPLDGLRLEVHLHSDCGRGEAERVRCVRLGMQPADWDALKPTHVFIDWMAPELLEVMRVRPKTRR